MACQKNFERNIHLCIAALEYIIAHITTMLLKGAWAAHETHEESVCGPLWLFTRKPNLFACAQISLFTKNLHSISSSNGMMGRRNTKTYGIVKDCLLFIEVSIMGSFLQK